MKISRKAEYAIRAVIRIAESTKSTPIQISEISRYESIPIKFLEQILLNLRNYGILKSKRGANGGYLLAKPSNQISVGIILEIIDGPFDPIRMTSANKLGNGLDKCFKDLIKIVNDHLYQFTIEEIIKYNYNLGTLSFDI